jgi:Isochorismatase family
LAVAALEDKIVQRATVAPRSARPLWKPVGSKPKRERLTLPPSSPTYGAAVWRGAIRECLDLRLLELMPPLAALCPPATVIDKTRYSVLAERRLAEHLRQREAAALIVSGSETDVCVGATNFFDSQWPRLWFRKSPVRSSAPTYSRPTLTLLPARSTSGRPYCRRNRVGRCSSSARAGFGSACRCRIRRHQNAFRNCTERLARERAMAFE